jgi:hypothetical protein
VEKLTLVIQHGILRNMQINVFVNRFVTMDELAAIGTAQNASFPTPKNMPFFVRNI